MKNEEFYQPATGGLTIESFFLADYQRVKARNEELQREIEEVRRKYDEDNPNGGFRDLHATIEMVSVSTEFSDYSLFKASEAPLLAKTRDELSAIVALDDQALAEWASKTRVRYGGKIVSVDRKVFPFTVEFSSYRGERRYAYDPDGSSRELIEIRDEADTGSWVPSEFEGESVSMALSDLRDVLRGRIEALDAESGEEK